MIELNELKIVDTPARYIGGESRQVIKNVNMVTNRVALAVPTMYEMGMFDFDFKKLYYTLNNRKDTWCERVFAPFIDFENLLRNTDNKLYTLESKTILRNMDVVIFSIPSELMYTNVLNMLNLGGIPCLSSRRKEGFPLIIATGSAVLNPRPMEEFIDLFIIGEPNKVINEIMDVYKITKESFNVSKIDMLQSMRNIPGVYIPSVMDETESVYMVEESLETEQPIKSIVIPSIPTGFDKTIVTLSKGCSRNCTMCPHKYVYGKPEYMSTDKGVLKTKRLMDTTGNTDVMLMTNCYADYSGFPEIIYRLNDLDRPKVKRVYFMETKLNKDNLWILKYLDVTGDYPSIIVGAPTEELREKVGIDIDEDEVLMVAREIFNTGFDKVRLKYILGIPGENYEDFQRMFDLADKVCDIYKEVYAKSPDKYIVEINLYNFTARPHTPTQWCAVNNVETIEIKIKYIMGRNKNQNVVISTEDGRQTVISTLLARGGTEVGQVIYEAWKEGAKFDMLPGVFDIENWQVALNKTGVEIKKYLEEQNDKLLLPWDNIKVNTSTEELRRIYINKFRSIKQ